MSTDESKKFQYYSAFRAQGKSIRLEAILICPLCGNAYHIDMMHGASHNHCGAVACKLAHSSRVRITDNIRRLKSYHKAKALVAAEVVTEAVYV